MQTEYYNDTILRFYKAAPNSRAIQIIGASPNANVLYILTAVVAKGQLSEQDTIDWADNAL